MTRGIHGWHGEFLRLVLETDEDHYVCMTVVILLFSDCSYSVCSVSSKDPNHTPGGDNEIYIHT